MRFIWPRLLLYFVVMNRHSFQRLVLKQIPTTLIMSIKALCTTLHVFNNTVPNTQTFFSSQLIHLPPNGIISRFS